MSPLDDLREKIALAWRPDRHRFRREAAALARIEGDARYQPRCARLAEAVERSVALRRARAAGVPAVLFDESLPVSLRREEIAAVIRDHAVTIVCGETGSGKSTQLPKICLALGRGVDGFIGHTQPRRIAARSIAARVAEELGAPLGRHAGYKVRFAESLSPTSYVKLMTDGILLAELQGDPYLSQYDTIIIDEAHERSLNIDFLLGHLKGLTRKRDDLRLIVTSATIDAARFAEHFATAAGPAPVVEVSGRTYPVEVRWRPPLDEEGEADWLDAVVAAAEELAAEGPGDMLIFMPTERDIHETAKALRGRTLAGGSTEILPLYARLSVAEQQRVFQPHGGRRIVIATNVAESSLTVPGIRYVIDPGTARISRYSPRAKTQRLPIEPISRASADQRMGRCGRVGPGICVRLFGEADYLNREAYTPPEIQRTNLAAVILQMKAFRLGEIETFPFPEPPRSDAIRAGYQTLFELGALDDRRGLTPIGRQLSKLPLDPRIGRMILAAADEGALAELLIIAAAIELQDPRERPLEKQQAADEAHARFAQEGSDFLAYLTLWDFFSDLRQKLSRNQLRKACRQNFLSYNRMREWTDLHRELLEIARQAGLRVARRHDDYRCIHRAILAGLLSSIALRGDAHEYTAAGGGKFNLWPGSVLFDRKPQWIVAAEMVETGRKYLRCCAKIEPRWIEPLAAHLVRRSYSEVTWDAGRGSTMATERVSLFGLVIVPARRVAYGPVDPAFSRQLFIEEGLLGGQLPQKPDFVRHNEALLDELHTLQDRLRRLDLLRPPWTRYVFYDRRIPMEIVHLRGLTAWMRRASPDARRSLWMAREDLLTDDAPSVPAGAFPETLATAVAPLPLAYRFEPGADDDGLSVAVPIEALNQLDPGRLAWLVPGLVERKVLALLRTMPKELRRLFVPAADTARRVAEELPFGRGHFLEAVAAALSRLGGQPIPASAFEEEKLPDELRMLVRVVSAEGKELARGRDLDDVRRALGVVTARPAVAASADEARWDRGGLITWDFDELPSEVRLRRGDLLLPAHPALVDEGEAAALRLVDTPQRAERLTHGGLRRLFLLVAERQVRGQLDWLPSLAKMKLHAATLAGFELRERLVELTIDRAFVAGLPPVRRRADFDARLKLGAERVPLAVQDVAEVAPPLFEGYHRARLALEEAAAAFGHAVDDVRRQLGRLLPVDFLVATPWEWLRQFPRYLRAVVERFERIGSGTLARDRQYTAELAALTDKWQSRAEDDLRRGVFDPELEAYRWMLEEYRVSLFAQRLGTAVPVSAVRLERQWAKVGR